jgi:hypothetical protein
MFAVSSRDYIKINLLIKINLFIKINLCPASQVKKTEVRRDCSFAPTQLALCLRLATT